MISHSPMGWDDGLVRQLRIPRNRVRRWLENFEDRHGDIRFDVDGAELNCLAADGALATLSFGFGPIPEPTLEGALAHLDVDRSVALLLARKGGYAVGIAAGERLVASKTGSSYVQGTTKAGGWSQQRYARRRENQSKNAAASAGQAAAKVFQQFPPQHWLLTGGDRTAVDKVLASPELGRLKLAEPTFVGPTEDPRQRVLLAFIPVALGVSIELNELA